VVDVYYTFQPMFLKFITGPISMMRSAYFSPRTGTSNAWVQYYPVTNDTTVLCSGYPASTTAPTS
jgi:hypothetical protein